MAVSSGDLITAGQYNTLQNRLEQLLGVGSDDLGYGQTVTSSQVDGPGVSTDADDVTALQMQQLRDDMDRAIKHQTGNNVSIAQIQSSDLIGADVSTTDLPSFTGQDLDGDGATDFTLTNTNNTKGFNDYLTLMTTLEAGKDTVAVAETVDETLDGDTRTTQWNGTIDSEFIVTFADPNAMRHFFNAGGEVHVQGIHDYAGTGGDGTRDGLWKNMINNPGLIRFGSTATLIDGSSSNVTFPDGAVGFRQLTDTYQTIFRRDASAGTYGDSFWTVEARLETSNPQRLRFKITLVDDGPESNLDAGAKGSIEPGVVEPITADTTFDYGVRRARSTDFESDGTTRRFEIPAPSLVRTGTFE